MPIAEEVRRRTRPGVEGGRYVNRSFIPRDVDSVEHELMYVGIEIQGGTDPGPS